MQTTRNVNQSRQFYLAASLNVHVGPTCNIQLTLKPVSPDEQAYLNANLT